MSTPRSLIDRAGRPLRLDRQLGSGGEGAVFALVADPATVAKVYHQPLTAEAHEKLTALIGMANSALVGVTTWPSSIVYDAGSRQPVGFLMPRLIGFQEIWLLYHPAERVKAFPRAGWKFQVRAAFNLAAAFDEVHKTGCVIGDVQLKNAHVSPQALVRLVDCDSFQVRLNGRQFYCNVGLPHYIPPELQGQSLRGLVRTENHDRFGLAVLIYQLLFVGRHPYAGVYQGPEDLSFEQLIATYRFAQGPNAGSWGMKPPPFTPTFADIPADLGILFCRAFQRGGEHGRRPRAAEWLPVLRQLEAETIVCSEDPGHTYWRGAGGCVWCRLGANGGPEYYFGVSEATAGFAVDEARLRDVLRRLEAAQPPDFRYNRDAFLPAVRPTPEPLPDLVDSHHSMALVVGVTAVLCTLVIPCGFVRGFLAAIGLLGAVVFGVWFAVLWANSPRRRELTRRRRVRDQARDDLRQLEDEWEGLAARAERDYGDLRRSVKAMVADCRDLGPKYEAELRRLAANAEATSRIRHLRLHLITDASIPQIGPARVWTLALNGVVTAADIDEDRIREIRGFKDALTSNLTRWRDDVLRKFRFDASKAVSPTDHRALVQRLRKSHDGLLADLEEELRKVDRVSAKSRGAIEQLVPDVRQAVAVWDQAAEDLQLIQKTRGI